MIIEIRPASFPETSKKERFQRARVLANELKKLDGVESVALYEPFQKVAGIPRSCYHR
jgi:hypothetical protein